MEYKFAEYKAKELVRGELKLGGENNAGERIDVNNKYIERGGRAVLPVMGEFHFSRCRAEDWHEELSKMKAGGITVVSAYVIWIYHEETEGLVNFYDEDLDLRGFLLECKKVGLEVMLRIGPWCHGEVRNGGFPDWLMNKPYRLRENNDGYLNQVRRWYGNIAGQVGGMLYKDGGPIIGIQIENELCDDAEHLKTLKNIAIECGIVAPIYTVTGWNSVTGARIPVYEVLPVFGGYCDAPWEADLKRIAPSTHYSFNQMRNDAAIGKDLIAEAADDGWQLPYEKYPFATCELGGGLMNTHHRRYIIDGMDIYTLSLVKLGSGNNLIGYYMYHGGTNKIGEYSSLQESVITGYPNDYPILSYDFQAPISEYGEIREHYRLLNLLHMFVNCFGETLAPMEAVDALSQPDGDSGLRYAMRTNGRSGFVFVNHYRRLGKLEDITGAVIDTGSVKFPEIDVCGDISFFMPFNMDINGRNMEYATAQPLCRVGNKYFFAEIPGIRAEYGIEDASDIITLSWEEARYTRLLGGELYIGNGCDLYETGEGDIISAENRPYSYRHWTGNGFEEIHIRLPYTEPEIRTEITKAPDFERPYEYELNIGGGRKIVWSRVTVKGTQGFVDIEVPECDVMQLYIDGRLAADNYYYGKPWRLPAKMLNNRECYMAYSELRNDCYREF